VSKRGTHFEQSFLMDKCSCYMVIHRLLISLWCQLSHVTSIYDRPKLFCGLFSCFLEQMPNLGSQSIIGVRTAVFKISEPLLYYLFRRSRVRITFVKPLLCLNGIFPHEKAMLYQHTKFRFFHCFENYKSSVTKTTVTCELKIRLLWNFDTYHLKVNTS